MRARTMALAVGAVAAGWWVARGRPGWSQGFEFQDRVVLVTGGSRGLGLVLARKLASRGARLALCARRHDELDRAREDVGRYGDTPLVVTCDVADAADARRCVETVERELAPIDVLVNDAGVISVGPEETMTIEDYHRAMDVNFFGAVHMIEAALPSMRRRRAGRIVNVTSIGGKVAVPHLLPYTASKFALVGYSEGLRAELAREGIVVTTAVPGLMRTGSPRHGEFKGRHREEYAWFAIADSLPGLSMDADEAADRILDACRRGDAEVVLGAPARLASWLHGIFPGLSADAAGVFARWLPEPGGVGARGVRGARSGSRATRSVATAPTRRAERRNNQIPPTEA